MLKIKLSRNGHKNQPHFRVVVAEARSKVSGKNQAILGHYNPLSPDKPLVINHSQYTTWLSKGAQPTATVRHLVKKLS